MENDASNFVRLSWLKSFIYGAALIDWAIPSEIPSTIADTARYEIHFCMSTAGSVRQTT